MGLELTIDGHSTEHIRNDDSLFSKIVERYADTAPRQTHQLICFLLTVLSRTGVI